MSLAILAKKTRAMQMRRASGGNFAIAVTGRPANLYGKHAGQVKMGKGLGPRNIHGPQLSKWANSCVLPTNACPPHVPIKQKSYRNLYNSRINCGPRACNISVPLNDDSSTYISKKKIKTLKCPQAIQCCTDTVVTLDGSGVITSGQAKFTAGCCYTFSWTNPGDIVSINGRATGTVNTFGPFCLPSDLCATNEVVIVSSTPLLTHTYPIVLADTSIGNCPKNCPTNRATSASIKTTTYTRMRVNCPTTKTIGVRSSGDQIAFIKARNTSYVADPVPAFQNPC